jgi:hypothetical protein
VDVSVTNGGSLWDTTARLDVIPTDRKQFDKTNKQTIHVKRVRFADAEKMVSGLPNFSEHVSDDEFVPDTQPNEDPPALPKNLTESVKSSYSISLADLPKMHRTLNHPTRSQIAHIVYQALNVDTLPEDLQNAADLVHVHCVICVKSSRPVPRLRVALSSVHQPGVCASVDYGDIHHPRLWITETSIIRLAVKLSGYLSWPTTFLDEYTHLLWTKCPSLGSELLKYS